jgi:hypothetical protein
MSASGFTFDASEQFWQKRPDNRRAFETPEELRAAAENAFTWLHKHPKRRALTFHYKGAITKTYETCERPFTFHALALRLGLSYNGLNGYRDKPGFAEVMEWIDDVIYVQKFEGAATGLLNPNFIARDLGLAEKSEVKSGVTVIIEGEDADL